MKTVLHDTYVAGMWLRHLPLELLWSTNCVGLDHDGTISSSYRAPSFSWASTDLPIDPSPEVRFLREPLQPTRAGIIVDVCIVRYRPSQAAEAAGQWEDEAVTEDLFGPFSSPEIELKVVGKLTPAKLHAARIVSGVWQGAIVVLLGADGLEIDLRCEHPVRLVHDWELERSRVEEFLSRAYYYIPWRYEAKKTTESDHLGCMLL